MSFDPLKSAKATLAKERKGLQQLEASLGDDFARAVDLLSQATGRVIVSGMGKSGHIGRKIAATLASTGTPSQFVHPAEASHGDLGMITSQDVILAMSWSGETNELANLITYAARFDIPLIALTSKRNSLLGRTATICLTLPAAEEACPNGLAPTTSTTMQLALGDALAVALLQKKNFSPADFKNFHPGGKLGANLMAIEEIMHAGDELPLIGEDVIMSEAIVEMTRKGFGCLGVTNKKGQLIGIITDGDLRRHMSAHLLDMTTGAIMTHSPLTVSPAILAAEALKIMNSASIQCVFICKNKKPLGLVRILDLLRIGTA
jgi:arabinose-5-phosphate isomerase